MVNFNKYLKVLMALWLCVSCSDYLDVVPDNTVEVVHLFETKTKAYSALAACYSFLPNRDQVHSGMHVAGDEFLGRLDPTVANNRNLLRGVKLMRNNWQDSNQPILNYWNGGQGATALYDALRVCNTFLANIDLVPDISLEEKEDWIAQVKFLKGYYHFYLLNKYGPIIIADINIEPSDGVEVVRQSRQPVDTCFDYIITLFDEAIEDLSPNNKSDAFLGQIDKTIAMGIKAKVLMYAASPLFNGNAEFYNSFLDENQTPYFNQQEDPEKWKLALDAVDAAIEQALSVGKSIYVFNEQPSHFDIDDWDASGVMKYAYSNRFSIVDSWNNETIWGYSNINDRNSSGSLQTVTNMRAENSTRANNAWQWLGATYRMSEMFYSLNGVPIDEDKTFDYTNRLNITVIPENDDYHLGYLQPLERTINLHLNREPRFYAWLATDRGMFRTQSERNNLRMRNNESPGGKTHSTDFYSSGIGIKKYTHPETTSDNFSSIINYPIPIMRLSELYLMRAEIRNEYSGPEQRVYDDLNIIRTRAGLPDVEAVYSNSGIVENTGKYLDKYGLRDIIHTERMIELCFEGHRYDDIRRWKRASEFFTTPVLGWNIEKSLAAEFYSLQIKQTREWVTPRDYLFPLKLDELRLNPKLKQNPGWDR